MKTPTTIRISKESNKSKRHKRRQRGRYRSQAKPKGNIESEFSGKHKRTYRRKHGRTRRRNQSGGTSVLPTILVNIYDSVIHGVSNFVNVIQGVEEAVSPLPYLDHF